MDVEDTWAIFTGRHSSGDLYAQPFKVKRNLRKEVSVKQATSNRYFFLFLARKTTTWHHIEKGKVNTLKGKDLMRMVT